MEHISNKDLESMATNHNESYQAMKDDLSKWSEQSALFFEQAQMHVDAAERCYNAYLQIRKGMFAMDPVADSPIADALNKPATVAKLPDYSR